MQIFVTGADGFLGGAIAEALVADGHEVGRWGRSEGALVSAALQAQFARQSPDVIVHTAGPAVVGASMEDPLHDFRRGSCATAEVLDAVRRGAPKARVIFLSSAAVYGNPERLPVAETARVEPLSPYGFHKRISEILLEEYRAIYGLQSVSLRVFSAYGEGLRKQVLWDICRKAAEGCVVLQGDGSQSRDFLHRDDVSSAVVHLAQSSVPWPAVLNLAYGKEVTVAEAAGWMADELQAKEAVLYDGVVPAGNPQRWEADTRLIQALGWKPKVDPETGIRAFARWAHQDLQSHS